MPTAYLKRILTSKVYEVAHETPLDLAKLLSARSNNTIFLKREDSQPVFSFKIRGAYNRMANLSSEELKRGVIAASAGNHAQGVAYSAKKLGCRAVIVMPTSTPQVKIDAVKRMGGEVVLAGDSYSDAYEHSVTLQKEQQLTFVHPFDDPEVIAGQGTIAMEILRQHAKPIHAVFCAVGGGGLISGVAAYIKRLRPQTRIIGVEAVDADAMTQSLAAGKRVRLKQVGLFADGAALLGEEFDLLLEGAALLDVGEVDLFDLLLEVGDFFAEGGEEGAEGFAVLGGELRRLGVEDLRGENLELVGELRAGGLEGVELGLEADGVRLGALELRRGAEVRQGIAEGDADEEGEKDEGGSGHGQELAAPAAGKQVKERGINIQYSMSNIQSSREQPR